VHFAGTLEELTGIRIEVVFGKPHPHVSPLPACLKSATRSPPESENPKKSVRTAPVNSSYISPADTRPMKMVTFGRDALTPLRRHLPLLKVALASATLVMAGASALQDIPLVATQPSGLATFDTARASRLPAASVGEHPVPGSSCPERDGAVLDQASSEARPFRLVPCSLFIGLVAQCRSGLGQRLFASEQAFPPSVFGPHP
jgi:hypothetical protein